MDYNAKNCVYSTTCIRKHILLDKTYHIYVFETALILSSVSSPNFNYFFKESK